MPHRISWPGCCCILTTLSHGDACRNALQLPINLQLHHTALQLQHTALHAHRGFHLHRCSTLHLTTRQPSEPGQLSTKRGRRRRRPALEDMWQEVEARLEEQEREAEAREERRWREWMDREERRDREREEREERREREREQREERRERERREREDRRDREAREREEHFLNILDLLARRQ
ncbi:Hypothetical predicted protein [Xyrichtys novacula]|uniref:Uncharacterized protein n=1 Tax=Xyrichtys novacula TaxID=13765 RepID=A0AAV1GK81_XYRNO|nr:Hypothetical predicted protein [Xyrichtys novacula]